MFNIKEYFNQIKNNKLFKTTVITYTIIACILFFLFSCAATFLISHSAIRQLTNSEQKMLEQAENTFDSILRNINYSITDTFDNNKTIQDALSKPYSPVLSLQITDAITTLKTGFDIIDTVYLFNLQNDIIYSGENPAYSYDNFPNPHLLDYIKSAPKYTINKPFVLNSEDGTGEKRVLASIYKLNDNHAMAVLIDSNAFNSMVNISSNNLLQSMTIYNSSGTVISSTDESLFGQDKSDDKIYRRLSGTKYSSGTFRNFSKVYFYRKSHTMDTLYLCEIRQSDIIGSFAIQFAIILLFGLVLIFLLFLSSIRLSVSVYRPFKRLRQNIGDILNIDNSSAETGSDEDLSLISKNISDIKSKYDAMQTTEQLYTNSKRNELIYNILNGSYNFDLDVLKEYNINFPYPYTTVILCRIDNAKKINYGDIGLVQYGIANVATEMMTNDSMLAYSTSFGGEYDVSFIVNHKNEYFDEKYLTDMQKYIVNIFSNTVTISYDTSEHNIESFSQLYRNTEYAIQYRFIKGLNSIINYRLLNSSIRTSDTAYPANIEKDIINAVKSKDIEAVVSGAKQFTDYLSSLPYIYIMVYSCILVMAIDMYSRAAAKDGSGDDIVDDFTKIETVNDLITIIKTKCSNAMIADDDVQTSKHTIIADNIEHYIDENYTNPNLSIHVIASHVNKSANYTRNIFKQAKGISISDYITKKRFGEVCRLLIETNMTAQAISQQIGMSSGSYFYTAFKKYTGYTPEQFRKKFMGTDFDINSIA